MRCILVGINSFMAAILDFGSHLGLENENVILFRVTYVYTICMASLMMVETVFVLLHTIMVPYLDF